MKIYLKLFATILVMAFLCISCGRNGSVNTTEKESDANVEEETSEASNNPLNIIGMTPVYNDKGRGRYLDYITLQTPNGDYMYDDEDAETYMDGYVSAFFMAREIASGAMRDDKSDIREYLENNLLDVVVNLPLDSSYPERIREYVNKLYYDNKDLMLYKDSRGYGYVRYKYTLGNIVRGKPYYLQLLISRKDDGRCILDGQSISFSLNY